MYYNFQMNREKMEWGGKNTFNQLNWKKKERRSKGGKEGGADHDR